MKPLAITVFLAAASAVVYFAFLAGYPINHDSAMLIQVADEMLRGGVPYRDIVETNPPMVGLVHAPPVLVSKATSLSIPAAFQFYVTLLLAFSCWQVWSFLGGLNPPFSLNRRLILLAVWLSGTISLQLTLDYGQREHLFALVLLPWLLCRLARHQNVTPSRLLTVPLGMAAAPFILLKPHFLGVVLGIEAVLALRSRRIRTLLTPEITLSVCWGSAYLVYLAALPPDAKNEFFGRWIPYLARHFSVYNDTFFSIQDFVSYLWMAGVVVWSAAVFPGLPEKRRFPALMFFLTTALCWCAFVVQGRGWYYHHIPARLLATGLIGFVIGARVEQQGRPWAKRVALAMGCLLVCFPVAALLLLGGGYRRARTDYSSAMTAKIRQYAGPGDAVDFIASDVRRGYPPMLYAGVVPGSRYDVDFMIPMLYAGVKAEPGMPFPYRTASEQTEDERRYLGEKAEDIEHRRPKLIAIDAAPRPQACPKGFRIDEYLESNGWREHAMAHYRYVETFKGLHLYVLK